MPERKWERVRSERVAVTDIDGVLADSEVPVVAEVNRRYGLALDHSDIDHWHWVSQKVTRVTGCEQTGREAEELWFDPEVLFRSKPIKGSVSGIRRLMENGWEVWAATSRKPETIPATLEWMDIYFPGIGSKRVYWREKGNEGLFPAAGVKALAIGMLGAKLYVEDDPLAVEYVSEQTRSGLVIAMITRGWNVNAGKKFEPYRVNDWNEVVAKSGKIRV